MLRAWEGFLSLSLLVSPAGYSVGVHSFLGSACFASFIRKGMLPGCLSVKDSESACQISKLTLVEWAKQTHERWAQLKSTAVSRWGSALGPW